MQQPELPPIAPLGNSAPPPLPPMSSMQPRAVFWAWGPAWHGQTRFDGFAGPALAPRVVAVMENRSSHKNAAVRAATRAKRRTSPFAAALQPSPQSSRAGLHEAQTSAAQSRRVNTRGNVVRHRKPDHLLAGRTRQLPRKFRKRVSVTSSNSNENPVMAAIFGHPADGGHAPRDNLMAHGGGGTRHRTTLAGEWASPR